MVSFDPSKRTVFLSAFFASLFMVSMTVCAVATEYKTVTIVHDGLVKSVRTFDLSVGTLLTHNGITVSEWDNLSHALTDSLRDGDVITIDTAQEYTVTANSQRISYWSAATSLDQVISDAYTEILDDSSSSVTTNASTAGNSETADETSRSVDASFYLTYNRAKGISLPLVAEETTLTVKIDGASTEVQLSGGETVEEAVALSGYELSALDEVQVSTDTGEVYVNVVTVQRNLVVQEETIEYETEEQEDDSLSEGQTTVLQQGQDGVREVVVFQYVRGGQVLYSAVVSEQVISEAVNQIVLVGTSTEDDTEDTETEDEDTEVVFAEGDEVWEALAQCESGGDPTVVSADGNYYGLYQFSLSTWQALGGTGLPSEADAETQTEMAKKLQAQSGWGQWPACAAALGLE